MTLHVTADYQHQYTDQQTLQQCVCGKCQQSVRPGAVVCNKAHLLWVPTCVA